jgi:hypothetical protein
MVTLQITGSYNVILITWYTTVSKERAALILKVKEYTK